MKQFLKRRIAVALHALLAIAVFATGVLPAHAEITTYTVYNLPDMILKYRISATQTSGIQVNPPTRNGVMIAVPSMSGAVFQLKQGTKIEDIYVSRVMVNATTKTLTFSGTVIRDKCYNNANEYVTCSGGQIFTPGTTVRLNPDAILFNRSLYKDRAVTTRGSGAIICGSTSQPCFFPAGVTTAQRNAFTYGLGTGLYPDIFNTTIGVKQYWNGSAWVNYGGSGTTVNASSSIDGKVRVASTGSLVSQTATGATGTYSVIPSNLVTATGGTTYGRFRIPLLNSAGLIAPSLGGTGSGSLDGSGFLVGNGTRTVRALNPSGSGNIVQVDALGRNFIVKSPSSKLLSSKIAANSTVYAGNTAENTLYQFAISGAQLSAGSIIKIHLSGTRNGAVTQIFRVRVGAASGTIMATATDTSAPGGVTNWTIDSSVTIRSTGAGGTAAGDLFENGGFATSPTFNGTSTSDISVNTTGSIRFTVTLQFQATGGSNAAHYEQAYATVNNP